MTRTADAHREDVQAEKDRELVRAVEFDLIRSLSRADCTLLGFSAKIDQYQCLITLRAFVDDLCQVSFVSSDTLAEALRKSTRMAKNDQLKWKKDEWARD